MTVFEPAAGASGIVAGLELVTPRTILGGPVEGLIRLRPGDRPLIAPGDSFAAGAPLAELVRDGETHEIAGSDVATGEREAQPGDRWAGRGGKRGRRRGAPATGELLYELDGRWRLAAGELLHPLEAPVSGTVVDVRPGIGIRFRTGGRAITGAFAVGSPVRGRLEIAAEPGAELRAGAIDVGRRGSILVVGARVDAETLSRARAMGVRGIVVAGLSSKERRDALASDERQRAARHRIEPFAVLVLDGSLRRPIASPLADVLRALAGHEVGILIDPPALVVGEEGPAPAPSSGDLVRIRSGPGIGEEGRWLGLAGLHRFAGGVHLDAGRVALRDGTVATVPLADLERFE